MKPIHHILPDFGKMKPDELTSLIKSLMFRLAVVEGKLAKTSCKMYIHSDHTAHPYPEDA